MSQILEIAAQLKAVKELVENIPSQDSKVIEKKLDAIKDQVVSEVKTVAQKSVEPPRYKTSNDADITVALLKELKCQSELLHSINERQKKENRRNTLFNITGGLVTLVIMGGIGYLGIHLELFDKDEVRSGLIMLFNTLFGAAL